MKLIALSMLVWSLVITSCSKDKNDSQKKTFEYFNTHLKADMSYTAILNEFGQPDKDIGSGIHIYVYGLADSTEIWIGYADKIIYARHVDKNQQVLHTII